MSRARRRGGTYQNITNLFYNNRNSKRWVVLESIPPELRKQVEQHIKKIGIFQELTLVEMEEEGAPAEEIGLTSTQITSEEVLSSQPSLGRALEQHLQDSYLPYLEHYLLQGQPHSAAYRYARICAFVNFLYQQEDTICEEVSEDKTKRLHLRSLHANVLALLDNIDLVVAVPKSDYYRAWWQQISNDLQQGKSLTEVVTPLRAGNQNTRKLHETAQQYLDYLYVSGAALPAKQIYRQLLAYAKEQGWWQTEAGLCPPSYRTIARYLEHRQADLSQARQGRHCCLQSLLSADQS